MRALYSHHLARYRVVLRVMNSTASMTDMLTVDSTRAVTPAGMCLAVEKQILFGLVQLWFSERFDYMGI